MNSQFVDAITNQVNITQMTKTKRSRREAINPRAVRSLSRVRHLRNISVCFSSIKAHEL